VTNVDVWVLGVAPAPLFLTWYFALRRQYVSATLVGGGTLLFLVLTGDAGSVTTLLGVVGGHIWTRPAARCESERWLDSLTTVAERLDAARSIVAVSDREGDVYRQFAHRPAAVDLVVRTGQDRKLADGGRLFTAARDWPELGRMAVEVPAHRPAESARTASLAVRARPVTLKRPGRAGPAPPSRRRWR